MSYYGNIIDIPPNDVIGNKVIGDILLAEEQSVQIKCIDSKYSDDISNAIADYLHRASDSRLGQDMAGETVNSMSGGCENQLIDFDGSSSSKLLLPAPNPPNNGVNMLIKMEKFKKLILKFECEVEKLEDKYKYNKPYKSQLIVLKYKINNRKSAISKIFDVLLTLLTTLIAFLTILTTLYSVDLTLSQNRILINESKFCEINNLLFDETSIATSSFIYDNHRANDLRSKMADIRESTKRITENAIENTKDILNIYIRIVIFFVICFILKLIDILVICKYYDKLLIRLESISC